VVLEDDGDEPEQQLQRIELLVEVQVQKVAAKESFKTVVGGGETDRGTTMPSHERHHDLVDALLI